MSDNFTLPKRSRKAGPNKGKKPPASNRPPKPYPDFPLYPHPLGYWSKKIRGTIYHFGRWGRIRDGQMVREPNDGWQAALEQYQKDKDSLYLGRTRTSEDERITLKDLCNRFLTYKKGKIGLKIGQRMFDEYMATTDWLIDAFGKNRLAVDLKPADFELLWKKLAKPSGPYGPVRLGNEIGKVKTLFKWGRKHGVIPTEPAYGDFDKPSKDELRKHRAANGKKLLGAEELQKLITAAGPQLKAMILLGVNCAFGNHDCALLPLPALDLKTGWINYPRTKNGIERRCPLWPETVAALETVIAQRPSVPPAIDNVFLTVRKRPWLSRDIANPISVAMRDLMKRCKVHRNGLGFYTLRHTFRTVADAAKDIPAIRLIMGHSDGSIDAVYREHIDDWRLQAVTDHVRRWLFGEACPGESGKKKI